MSVHLKESQPPGFFHVHVALQFNKFDSPFPLIYVPSFFRSLTLNISLIRLRSCVHAGAHAYIYVL